MQTVGNISDARCKVEADISWLLKEVRRLVDQGFGSVEDGIALLRQLRREVYEDLNQIQHEYAILKAAEWLMNNSRYGAGIVWAWNPRQTGNATEPDLRGILKGQIVISAEVTTSAKPSGVIDTRMAKTLVKLAQMEGEKFYFVVTSAMQTRAVTKIKKAGAEIEVVDLSVPVRLEGLGTTTPIPDISCSR